MSFEYLGLSDEVLAAVSDAGYTEPTPIQRSAIPVVLQGRDILGIAQTGTGKTAGFTLPMIDILAQGRTRARMPRSLILEPTRELAAQVADSFDKYGKNNKLTKALLIGGVSFGDQFKLLDRGVDVLIATPGRLLDHFERGKLMLTGVDILVIDEADRMLDMGFIPDVERICKLMPQRPQTLFFSATMPPEVKRLTDQFLRDPKLIEVAPPATAAETVEQALVKCSFRDKGKALRHLLRTENIQNALIFCNRKVDLKTVYASLKRDRFDVAQLHGDMPQMERMEVLAAFKNGEVTILMASDVAARGLDIPLVSHVINYDIPMQAEDYIHRIGRTGRAGRKGKSFSLATPKDAKFVDAIERLLGEKIKIAGDKSAEASAPAPAPAQSPVQSPAPVGDAPSSQRQDAADNRPAQGDRPPRRRRGRRGGKGRGGAQDGNQDSAQRTQSNPQAAPAATPRPDKKAAPQRNEPTVGWGDSMPGFMTTPVPKTEKKIAKTPAKSGSSTDKE